MAVAVIEASVRSATVEPTALVFDSNPMRRTTAGLLGSEPEEVGVPGTFAAGSDHSFGSRVMRKCLGAGAP